MAQGEERKKLLDERLKDEPPIGMLEDGELNIVGWDESIAPRPEDLKLPEDAPDDKKASDDTSGSSSQTTKDSFSVPGARVFVHR